MSTNPQEQVLHLCDLVAERLRSSPKTIDLAEELPQADQGPLRIALIGTHNAGKSTVVAALCGLGRDVQERIIDSTAKTDACTEYRWETAVILDLPGLHSGLAAHDTEARAGVRKADLALIVTTPELPNDTETAEIVSLLRDDAFAERAILVVNRANTEHNDADVVQAGLANRLGSWLDGLPVMYTDARDYLDADLPELSEDDRLLLRTDSGIPELFKALRSLVNDCPVDPRAEAQRQELLRALRAAQKRHATLTAEEEAACHFVDRATDGVKTARQDLEEAARAARSELTDEVRAIGERLAGAPQSDEQQVAKACSQALEDREKMLTLFQDRMNQAITAANDAVARVFGEVSQAVDAFRAAPGHAPDTRGATRRKDAKPGAFDPLKDAAKDKARRTLRKLEESAPSAGSTAHDLAKKINKLTGTEPKPYSHVNRAKDISKTARRVGIAMDALESGAALRETWDSLQASRADKAAREGVRKAWHDNAADLDRINSDAIRDMLDQWDKCVALQLEPVQQPVLELRSTRDAAQLFLESQISAVLSVQTRR